MKVPTTNDHLTENRGLFLFESILFILLGLFAIAIPQLFTLSIELLLGSLFVVGGVFQTFRLLRNSDMGNFWPTLIGSLCSIALGVLLLAYPIKGVVALTLLLAIFFLIQGIAQIILAFRLKPVNGYGWMLFSGVVTLILSYLIWSGLPSTAAWVIGLLVGINLLFTGFSLLFIWFGTKGR